MYPLENAIVHKGNERIINVQQSNNSSNGLQAFEHTRILIFDKPSGSLYIDFAKQDLAAESMYIIPPRHLYYYTSKESTTYLVIDLDENHFSKKYQRLLYAIKYSKSKILQSTNETNNSYQSLCDEFFENDVEGYKISLLSKLIDERVNSFSPNDFSIEHFEIARQLIELLKNQILTLDNCCVETYAIQLKCSIRTLRRVCLEVFHCSPSYIIKYHLTLNGIYRLFQGDKPSIVSKKLGFSSIAAFDRFIKRVTSISPSELKQMQNV